MKKIFFLMIGIIFFGINIIVVGAVDFKELTPSQQEEVLSSDDWSDKQNKNGKNCFDYYNFQSVQPSLGVEKNLYSAGEKVHIFGELVNESNQPVVNGLLFVRVAKKNGNYIEDGNFIIDEFIAIKDINLLANETKNISFDWTIPNSVSVGDYVFSFFFSVGNKFNLAGLPFSNEVIGSELIISIITEQTSFISFDRSNTKVNKQKYHHIGNWPFVEKDEEILIEQPILNTFTSEKNVKIVYELYYWDSLNQSDLINRKEQQITLKPDSNSILRYAIPKVNKSVYYLKIIADSNGQKSIVNIRIVSDNNNPRLNYPAITKFPLEKGNEVTLFTCFHNTSNNISFNNKVQVILKDKNDEEISSVLYNGDILPNMMAESKKFISQKKYNYLKLEAKIFNKDGKVIDSYAVEYDCKKFDSCDNAIDKQSELDIINIFKYILIVIFGLIFVGVIIFLIIKHYNK